MSEAAVGAGQWRVAAARKYFGSKNPVGELIEPLLWNGARSATKPKTVVGVVGNIKLEGIGEEARPIVYWPIQQIPSSDTLFVIVRAKGNERAFQTSWGD